MPLFILDRDGVINQDSDDYIKSASEWRPIPGSIDAIAKLHQAGYTVVIATNQSGLGRGYFSIDDLEAMHRKMRELVEAAGGYISGIYFCPHLPSAGCQCRKPNTGLLDSIEAEWGSVEGAPLVGDSLKDLQLAARKNCQPILVRTGKGQKTAQQLSDGQEPSLNQTPAYKDLAEAVNHYLEENH